MRRPYAERKKAEREIQNIVEHVVQTIVDYTIEELNGHGLILEKQSIEQLLLDVKIKLMAYAYPEEAQRIEAFLKETNDAYEPCASVAVDKTQDQIHDIVHMCRKPTGHKGIHLCDCPGCSESWNDDG